jgi:hypothetical protein
MASTASADDGDGYAEAGVADGGSAAAAAANEDDDDEGPIVRNGPTAKRPRPFMVAASHHHQVTHTRRGGGRAVEDEDDADASDEADDGDEGELEGSSAAADDSDAEGGDVSLGKPSYRGYGLGASGSAASASADYLSCKAVQQGLSKDTYYGLQQLKGALPSVIVAVRTPVPTAACCST